MYTHLIKKYYDCGVNKFSKTQFTASYGALWFNFALYKYQIPSTGIKIMNNVTCLVRLLFYLYDKFRGYREWTILPVLTVLF